LANRLFNLTTKEISFCKQGAVPSAKIDVFKSMDPPAVEIEKTVSGLTKAVQTIAKHLGINVAEGSPTVLVEKGRFANAWKGKELQSSFYDAFWTLDSVVWEILNDEKITDKAAKIKEAITEFAEIASGNLPTEEQVKKYIELRKQLLEPVVTQVHKIFEPVEKKSEGGNEQMTQEELAAVAKQVVDVLKEDLKKELPTVVKGILTEELKPVNEEIGKVSARVEEIGKMAPGSQQAPEGTPPAGEVKKGFWNGVL